MSKILKKISMFALAFALLFNFSVAAYAQEKSENIKEGKAISNEIRFKISCKNYMSFYFQPQFNGGYKLKTTSQVSDTTTIIPDFTIKVFDRNNNLVNKLDVKDGTYPIKLVLQEIAKLHFEKGYLIQIINYFEAFPGDIQISNVKGNLQKYDYNSKLDTTRSNTYGFRLEEDGLYEDYINQVRVADGVYKIEHPSFNFRVFDVVNGNIQIGDDNYSSSQNFTFQYDNKMKAYKIRTSDNRLVTWYSSVNYNVIAHPDGGYNDQYWYLERGGDNRYKIVSAHGTNRLLNIDSNNTNISAAHRNGNLRQEFDLRRN